MSKFLVKTEKSGPRWAVSVGSGTIHYFGAMALPWPLLRAYRIPT